MHFSAIRSLSFAAAVGVGLAGVGCGEDATGSGGGGGAGGAAGTGGSVGIGTASGTLDACKSEIRTPSTFIIRNDSSERLWIVGAGFGPSALSAITIDGQGSPACPCDELEGCNADPADTSVDVGYLEPGEAFEQAWVGLTYTPAGSGGCIPELGCVVGHRPTTGEHVAVATAYRGPPTCEDPCACDIADSVLCNFGIGAAPPSDPVEAQVSFSFPADGPVELSFTD